MFYVSGNNEINLTKISSNISINTNVNNKFNVSSIGKSLISSLPVRSASIESNTIALPANTIDIISVVGYERGLNPPLLGEYYFDPNNLELIINPPLLGENLYYYAITSDSPSPIPTNCVDIPDTNLLQSLNCIGDISFDRSFEGFPSATLTISGCSTFNWCDYPNGRQYSLFEVDWYQDSIALQPKNNGFWQATIDLISIHANPKFNRSVKKECRESLSVAQLASIVGARYSGSTLPLRIDRAMAYDTSFSFRSELESRAITQNKFVYYSGGSIETRTWGQTAIHHISPLDVKSISYSRPGDGVEIEDCLRLTNELYNAPVSFDFKETAVGLQLLVTIEGASSAFTVGLPPSLPTSVGINNDNSSNQPLIDDIVYNPSVCFDSGGKVQSINLSYQIGGVETISNKTIYGFAFTSLDSYDSVLGTDGHIPAPKLSPPGQASLWRQTSETTTIHYFDSNNYLYKIVTTGWELGRFKQESDQLEAINLQCQIDDEGDLDKKAKLAIERDLYVFNQRIPVNETTYYLLDNLRSHYQDIPTPSSCESEAKFVSKKITSRLNTINTVDSEGKPVTSGTWSGQEDVTTILWTYPPEKFSIASRSYNSSGSGLKNNSSIASLTEYSGRPGIQSKIIPLSDNQGKVNPGYYDRYLGKKFYLSTVGSDSGSSGSIAYPDTDDLADILSITKTKLSIANSKEAETLNLELIKYNHNINEGDRVSFNGKIYVVFAINSKLKITNNFELTTDTFKLSLGRLVYPDVKVGED